MSGYREHDARVYIEIAEKKLRICDKYAAEEPRMYGKLLAGESTFSIRRQDESGNYEQCSWAVMEALYNRKRTEPDSDIGEIFQQALLDDFAETVSPMHLKNCIDCLLYQLNSEVQKTAPFSVDVPLLVEALQANIQRNADRYAAFGILDALKNCDQRIFTLCGMHVMEEIPKNEQGSSDKGLAQAASKGAVGSRKPRVWRSIQTAVVYIGVIALAAAIAVRPPLWTWLCLGTGIACMLPSVVRIGTTKRAKKAKKEERTARKKWADAMLIAAAVCAAAAYGVAIALKLLVGYACHIPNVLGWVLIALIGSAILTYGLYDILLREKKLKGDRMERDPHVVLNTQRQPSAKPVPPVRVNREARDADPLGYPIPFKTLWIYPERKILPETQNCVVLHHLEWETFRTRRETDVILCEEKGQLYRLDRRVRKYDEQDSYTSTIRAQLAFDVKPEHHIPLVEWIMSLQTDHLREYADHVIVEDKTVRTWEDKYEIILKHSEMKEPVEYQNGWNCTYSDIGMNFRGQKPMPTLFLERTWLDVPSRVPYNVYIEMEPIPENRSANYPELCALIENMVFSDPNEADKLMAQFRSWLNVDALRKKEELYAASVQANPTGVEARMLDDVQKQIALLEKAEP